MTKTDDTLQLPPFFSDGMILQRNKELKMWGWDKAGTTIQITFKGDTYQTKANFDGYWEVSIGQHIAGGPYTISVEGSSHATIQDIYIGEVWLAGGQSNMELPINRVTHFHPSAIEDANYPLIRQFQVTQTHDFHAPQERTFGGEWIQAIPKTIQDFSAVGFFFARNLYDELKVPIGIYLTAWGGTPAEAWMSEDTLNKIGVAQDNLSYLKDDKQINATIEKESKAIEEWYHILHETDRGLHAETPWYSTEYVAKDWNEITIPKMFRETQLQDFIGVVWFRKEIDLDKETIEDEELYLRVGTLIDADDVYVNGVHIGCTDYRYPPRVYKVANNLLKPGVNLVTVRLEVTTGLGGFIPEMEYALKGKNTYLSIEGEWRYKVSTYMEKPLIQPLTLHNKPIGLYNAILYPLRNLQICGAIYYQGESNGGEPENYDILMEHLIEDWRDLWGDKLPFYFVQLANYFEPTATIDDRNWAIVRDKQNQVSQKLDHVGLVSAIDVGEDNELHPPEKMTLGKRLANFALDEVYGREKQAEHHRLETINMTDQSIQLFFVPEVTDLYVSNGKQADIELQEESGEWVVADSEITDYGLNVFRDSSKMYKGIRYAWRNAPTGVLVNRGTNLPVLPFKETL